MGREWSPVGWRKEKGRGRENEKKEKKGYKKRKGK
jgi:hypothetical protein